MEKEWTPEQLEGQYDNAIIVIAPYAGNGNQLQIISSSTAAKPSYYILLKNQKGEGRWFITDDPAPYKEGELLTYKRRKHLIVDVLPAGDR